jgi:hypothetical protein
MLLGKKRVSKGKTAFFPSGVALCSLWEDTDFPLEITKTRARITRRECNVELQRGAATRPLLLTQSER